MFKSIFASAATLFSSHPVSEFEFKTDGESSMGNAIDVSTYGNIDYARTFHLSLDLVVDFPNKRFQGVAIHQIDSVGQDIHGVEWAQVGTTNWNEA